MNRNQQQLYQDVHRIAQSLREIVEILKNEFKNQSLLIDISLHLGSLLAILFYFKDDNLLPPIKWQCKCSTSCPASLP